MTEKNKYTANDLALLIPTKDRPEKMKKILQSIADQTVKVNRVIVVNGGEDIKDIVLGFSNKINVEYHECYPPGQIRQRNKAISLLNDDTPLAASFDDDIILELDAVEKMIDYWNECEDETAGISFNIINFAPDPDSFFRKIIGLSSSEQGRVVRSGRNTNIFSVKSNIRTQWLCGGATVWKQEILKKYLHREVNTPWAMCEDLIFSYPIGKNYPLYVCANAKVHHIHEYDHKIKKKYIFYGRAETLWRLYFEESHKELSRFHFFWNLTALIMVRLFLGIFTFKFRHLHFAFGQIQALFQGVKAIIKGNDLIDLLKEE